MTGTERSGTAGNAYLVLSVRVPDDATGEWAAAEAFEAGAAGVEERDGNDELRLLVYVPAGSAAAVRDALQEMAAAGVAMLGEEPAPDEDWSEAWKAGLVAIEISERLRVRPSFVEAKPLLAGQAELVIDPAQAFGTGGHESTRLALECLDALAPLAGGTRVLDVGAGTGVLALAALRLGAAHAVAFDTDPLAAEATRENAAHNGLASKLVIFTGPIEALRTEPFELVLANMLRREVTPLLAAIAARARPGGAVVFSGLLASDRAAFTSALAGHGLEVEAARTRTDASGAEWLGLVARR